MSIDFDKLQRQIKGDFFRLCKNSCAGMCEKYYVSYYLPKEDRYIAVKLKIKLREFRNKYVTVLKFRDGSKLNLLRISNPCPFLSKNFHCGLEQEGAKLIACKMYPFCPGVKNGSPRAYLDYHCPLVWNKKLPAKFFHNTKKAFNSLRLFKYWLKNVNKLGYFYDYDKLSKLNPRQTTYEELQKCLLS